MLNSPASIRERFESLLHANGIEIFCRIENPSLWHQYYDSLSRHCLEVSCAEIDYQIEYGHSHNQTFDDLSSVLMLNGQAVALWPLSVCTTAGHCELTSFGGYLLSPSFLRGVSQSLQTKISKTCYKVCIDLAIVLGQEKIVSKYFDPSSPRLSPWHVYALQTGATCTVRHEALIDLSHSIQEIKASFRKSYKSLINRSEKIWHSYVVSNADLCEEWAKFKALHINVSGRQTRSDRSWMLQKEAVLNNESFLVVVYRRNDSSRDLIGAGLFTSTRSEGSYSVGAYDRSYFDQPVSHIVQLRAIEELKKRGCNWYYIGRCHFSGDSPTPDQKLLSISLFKTGFANHFSCSYELSHMLDHFQS